MSILLIIDRDNGIVEAGVAIAVGVFDLSAVAGVVQEALGVGFGDEPVNGCEHVVAGGVEGAFAVVGEDNHAFFVGGIALADEELGLCGS